MTNVVELRKQVNKAIKKRELRERNIVGRHLIRFLESKKKISQEKLNLFLRDADRAPTSKCFGGTYARYRFFFQRFIKNYGEFNTDTIHAWHTEWLAGDKSAGTYNLELKIIKAYDNYLFNAGITKRKRVSPAIYKPKTNVQKHYEPLKEETINHFMGNIKRDPIIAYVKLGLLTGLRVSELMLIPKLEKSDGYYLIPVKGGHERRIKTNRQINALIKICKKRPFNTSCYLNRVLREYLIKHDLEIFTFHSLRATFATKLYKNNIRLEKISRLLGHHSIETTRKYIQQLRDLEPVELINPYIEEKDVTVNE